MQTSCISLALSKGRAHQRSLSGGACAWAVRVAEGSAMLLAITRKEGQIPRAEVVYVASSELKDDFKLVALCLFKESGLSGAAQNRLVGEFQDPWVSALRRGCLVRGSGHSVGSSKAQLDGGVDAQHSGARQSCAHTIH